LYIWFILLIFFTFFVLSQGWRRSFLTPYPWLPSSCPYGAAQGRCINHSFLFRSLAISSLKS
jgi:hypothetical protein